MSTIGYDNVYVVWSGRGGASQGSNKWGIGICIVFFFNVISRCLVEFNRYLHYSYAIPLKRFWTRNFESILRIISLLDRICAYYFSYSWYFVPLFATHLHRVCVWVNHIIWSQNKERHDSPVSHKHMFWGNRIQIVYNDVTEWHRMDKQTNKKNGEWSGASSVIRDVLNRRPKHNLIKNDEYTITYSQLVLCILQYAFFCSFIFFVAFTMFGLTMYDANDRSFVRSFLFVDLFTLWAISTVQHMNL